MEKIKEFEIKYFEAGIPETGLFYGNTEEEAIERFKEEYDFEIISVEETENYIEEKIDDIKEEINEKIEELRSKLYEIEELCEELKYNYDDNRLLKKMIENNGGDFDNFFGAFDEVNTEAYNLKDKLDGKEIRILED